MELSNQPISNFFLAIYQHEFANCINTANQITQSLLSNRNIEEGLLSDIVFDQQQVFLESNRLLAKMRILLYPSLTLQCNESIIFDTVQNELNLLPPNPFRILNKTEKNIRLTQDIFSQITYSVIQILIKNKSDQYDAKHQIQINSSATGIIFDYKSEQKHNVLTQLSQGERSFTEKSVLAFEYEFLLLMRERYPLEIISSRSIDSYHTEFKLT